MTKIIENFDNVTFVIIGRNEATNLPRCFQSIVNYSKNIIFVDSNSTDNSVSVAKKFGIPKILSIESDYYSASLGRVVGAKYATTEYIQFLDGDMKLEEGWLDAAMRKMESNKKIAIVHGFKKEFKTDEYNYKIRSDSKDWQSDYLQGAYLIKRDVYENAGGLDPNFPGEEERDFYVRVRKLDYEVWYIHHLMASHYDFKIRGYKYLLNSEVAGAILVPLFKSLINGNILSYIYVYRRLLPVLLIDMVTLILLICFIFNSQSTYLLLALISQIIGLFYSLIIKRPGYFIIWKSAIINIHRSLRIFKREIIFSVREL
ncbi:glycosyltransferase [Gammaproteobacteria bacterium]|nr:glycosyltransferase [Gammaproteobacteria bacterium]